MHSVDQSQEPVAHPYSQVRPEQRRELERLKMRHKTEREYREAHEFFTKNLRSVEISWNGSLDRIWFPVPSECVHLLATTKSTLRQVRRCRLNTSG